MKTIKTIIAVILLSISITSCSEEDKDPIIIDENPLAEYNLVTNVDANNHSIEIYSEQKDFTIGFNQLFIRIKDNDMDTYISNASIQWKPVMHMTEMMHSCPKSDVTKTENATVYTGYVVFQMPGNSEEYWDLELEYTANGQVYNAIEKINVKAPLDGKRRVNSFVGEDDSRYVMAMMPFQPEIAVNDFEIMVFKMENMMNFPVVKNHKIVLDPRMPGMGNHGSPNNEDLVFDVGSGLYKGKLSLTMSGYWKLNLILVDENAAIIKGETITSDNESSSLFFEIEF
ncbi:hypothetical protein [Eudoraea chungangensis]|uniref:hypothetical protein n=1 Tax=Eudoraea chungangensis TaxID=1481905 RepID=UPI0023ED9BF6|nr:hypothetical protein [Eudoraea chungangensis]